MKKGKFVILVVVSMLACVILANIIFNKPPTSLNEDYINSWILTGTESIDRILYTSESQNYVACICSVSDDEMMLLILENNETFDMHFRHSFTLNTLTEDPIQIQTDEMFSDEDIMYNIFLNPNVDTVTVNDAVKTVNRFQYNDYDIGFWWSEISGEN